MSEPHGTAAAQSSRCATRCVVLGRIGAAYGVKGWFHLQAFADDPEAWLALSAWWLSAKEPDADGLADWRVVTPAGLRVHGDGCVAQLNETPERSAAEALRGYWLGAPREALPAPETDSYYWADLVGLAVVNTQNEILGHVARLIETGANAVLVVRDESQAKSKERLIPFVAAVVLEVVQPKDGDAGRIVVDWGSDW